MQMEVENAPLHSTDKAPLHPGDEPTMALPPRSEEPVANSDRENVEPEKRSKSSNGRGGNTQQEQQSNKEKTKICKSTGTDYRCGSSGEIPEKAKLKIPRVVVKGRRTKKGAFTSMTPPSMIQSKTVAETELTEIVEEEVIEEGRVQDCIEEWQVGTMKANLNGKKHKTWAELEAES